MGAYVMRSFQHRFYEGGLTKVFRPSARHSNVLRRAIPRCHLPTRQ
jgi:hypothetical protein